MISEGLLYTPCFQCGTSEFKKTESGPKYHPCACFQVTIGAAAKKEKFVTIKKNQDTNLYSLKFSGQADKQLIAAFLLTLQDKLDEYQN